MKIFTLSGIFTLMAAAVNPVAAQSTPCGTGGTFTAASINTFDTNREGFTGDFNWSSGGSGQMESTDASVSQSKKLRTFGYTIPATFPTMYWSFNLGGTMNIQSYSVSVIYNSGTGIVTLPLCSGNGLQTTGSNLTFYAATPEAVKGQVVALEITFNSNTSGTGKFITVDNFRVNAFSSNIVLPVNFKSLTANSAGDHVALTWKVGTENNVRGYEVERSADGSSFATIGFVSAKELSSYNYTDNRPLATAYYRIKSIDLDGKLGYSAIVSVKGDVTAVMLKSFPVPARNTLTLQHDVAGAGSIITLNGTDGRMLKQVIPTKGEQQTNIDISSLAPGVYYVQYNNGNYQVATLKVMKQ